MDENNDADHVPQTWRDIRAMRVAARIKLLEIEKKQLAREVAGKSIGKYGLFYITVMVAMGIGASLKIEGEALAAITGLLGVTLAALIQMLHAIAGTKEEPPEIEIIRALISMIDKISEVSHAGMSVDIDRDKISVVRNGTEMKSLRPHDDALSETT